MLSPTLLRRAAPALGLLLAGLTGCGGSDGATAGGDAIKLTASDEACQLARTDLPAGRTTFTITNTGSKVTEVYVYGPNDKIITEKENIGPGISYDLTVALDPGRYEVACKPGQTGNGIRTAINVTGA